MIPYCVAFLFEKAEIQTISGCLQILLTSLHTASKVDIDRYWFN